MSISELRAHAVDMLNSLTSAPACKVCGSATNVFDLVDFNKTGHSRKYPLGISGVPVTYHRCVSCEFIFTDFFDLFTDDQWTEYVYNSQYYSDVDPDYADVRPRQIAEAVCAFLAGSKLPTVGLDYGGGNGRTVELLRDAGLVFDCWDPYGQTDMTPGRIGKYNFCTSIEVFEHTPDPAGSLGSLIEKCTSDKLIVMVGTSVHDGSVSDETRLNWWYAAPRNGHISLHSRKSLRTLASRFDLTYVSLSKGMHLMVRGYPAHEMRFMLLRGKVRKQIRAAARRAKING